MGEDLPPAEPTRVDEYIRVGDHFYVLAVSARADERTRVLKHNDTFAVLNRTGDMLTVGLGDQGLFHQGTRHLSRLDLDIEGQRPLLLSAAVDDSSLVYTVNVTNPDLTSQGEVVVPRGSVHILRTAIIWQGTLLQQFHIHNFHLHPVRLRLSIRFEADFVDIFEVRGVERARRGQSLPPRIEGDSVILGYHGLDGVRRETVVAFGPKPESLAPDRATFQIALEAGTSDVLDVRAVCSDAALTGDRPRTMAAAVDSARQRLDHLRAGQCGLNTSSAAFNRWLTRSRTDLFLMLSQTPAGVYPYAGIPWFSTPFGRDGLITALETLWVDPGIARGVLSFLSRTQAAEEDPTRDAEPGKIMHEFRAGEMPALGEVPYARYYGSIDSTPLYVALAGAYLRATGDIDFIGTIRGNIDRAIAWMDRWGDRDGDGFVEYQAATPNGLNNQGWKDSLDSVFFEDGTLAPSPKALCEVQGYVYAARIAASEIAAALGDAESSIRLAGQAEQLKASFDERFWDEELGTYSLALCAEKRPCRVATSNAGHCLFTGIARKDRAHCIAEDMLSPRFFSGWGIRTLADGQPRYNPMSYHNGSIWPHDTALIAAGMAKYGRNGGAAQLLDAMFDVSTCVELNRLPELFCGFERRRDEGPIRYPVACSPQSWAAGAVFLMLQSCLGLEVRGDRNEVVFRGTTLPRCLDHVEINDLRVGQARVDLAIERAGHEVRVHTLRRDPSINIVVSG